MRKSRLKKYTNNSKKIRVMIQLLAILYGCTLAITYLSSNTIAAFSSSQKETIKLQAGSWWDGSELEFVKNNAENIKSCSSVEIIAEIKNKGFTMSGPTKYEVYYNKDNNGNPQKKGELIATGEIDPIGEGQIINLSYVAENTGSYMFKAYQHPDYNGKQSSEIWSHKMMVKCSQNHVTEKEVDESKEVIDENESAKEEVDIPKAEEPQEQKPKAEESVKEEMVKETPDMSTQTEGKSNETQGNPDTNAQKQEKEKIVEQDTEDTGSVETTEKESE
ncbi:amyloid fiber anchoring/assembly protein TapA [Robertmurraya massiliosenegalensis]|uniref:amyloid fiber anchoring/assembly protein TapA n=1 Tax=Robertmurraya massiliosenegalensis TaxID=1287657 RepID=UPI0002D9118C|nr:amyloid fiber anchoring/assembly protein TapA [Robertmurraya massiliosenegalensis]